MPPENFDQLLDSAAVACGIEAGYWDIWGNRHATSTSVKQAILNSMEIAADTPEELVRSLTDRARREWERLLSPSVVTPQSRPRLLPIQVPADMLGERARVTLRREDGSSSEFEVS